MKKNFARFQLVSTVAFVFVVVLLSWYEPISNAAAAYVDDGLKRSLVSFASARALNGVISVLQGTQFVAEPLGFGVVLTLGEILDPINDMVEAFSSVMLTASVAFGIQKLLLTIGSNTMVSTFITGVAVVWAVLFWWGSAPNWLSRLLAVLLFVRFVMPVTMIGSGYVFDQFSKHEYQQGQASLVGTAESLNVLRQDVDVANAQPPAQPEPSVVTATPVVESPGEKHRKGWWDSVIDRVRETVDDVKTTTSKTKDAMLNGFGSARGALRAKLEAMSVAAERAAENMIRLIVIFLMQTIVVPIILFWGLYRLIVGSMVVLRHPSQPQSP